jgi:hypothetical protein
MLNSTKGSTRSVDSADGFECFKVGSEESFPSVGTARLFLFRLWRPSFAIASFYVL